MKQLLKIEWLKLKNYTPFKLLSIFFAIGIVATNWIVQYVSNEVTNNSGAGTLIGKFNPYNFDLTWQTTSYVTGFLLILPAMILLIITTNEFTFRTSRQNIIDGLSREQFISVKLVLAVIFAIVSTFLVILVALGLASFSNSTFSLSGFAHVGYFLTKALTYNLLAVFISVWIRKTGFAIGLYFIYLGAENILSQILWALSLKIKKENAFDPGNLGDYLPMNASDGLLTFPDNSLKSMTQTIMPTDYTWLVMLFAFFYIILFYWLSRKNLLTKDL